MTLPGKRFVLDTSSCPFAVVARTITEVDEMVLGTATRHAGRRSAGERGRPVKKLVDDEDKDGTGGYVLGVAARRCDAFDTAAMVTVEEDTSKII